MSEDTGLFPKYLVFKHPKNDLIPVYSKDLVEVDAFCFVLKVTDKHARIAMATYAESVKDEKPQLAKDIYEVLSDF